MQRFPGLQRPGKFQGGAVRQLGDAGLQRLHLPAQLRPGLLHRVRIRLAPHPLMQGTQAVAHGGQIAAQIAHLSLIRLRGGNLLHDGVLADPLLGGVHAIEQPGDGIRVRLAFHIQLQKLIAPDVQRIQGGDGGVPDEQRVHIQIRGDQLVDQRRFAKDALGVQGRGGNAAGNQLFPAVNGMI